MVTQHCEVINATELYTWKLLKLQILCYRYFTTIKNFSKTKKKQNKTKILSVSEDERESFLVAAKCSEDLRQLSIILLPIESIIMAHASKSSAQISVTYTCQWGEGRTEGWGQPYLNDLDWVEPLWGASGTATPWHPGNLAHRSSHRTQRQGLTSIWGFLGGSVVKNSPARQETRKTWVPSLDWEDPVEEETATLSSIFVFPDSSVSKQSTTIQETLVRFLGWEDPVEKG